MSVPLVDGNSEMLVRNHSLAQYDPKVELWHQDGGNVLFTSFMVPISTSSRAVEKEFLRVGKTWINNMHKDGWDVLEKSVACLGPVITPDPENLDMHTYYIGATYVRHRPQMMTLDSTQVLLDAEKIKNPPGKDFFRFLKRLQSMGIDYVERGAKGWKERAAEEWKLREEVDEINRKRGA